MQVPQLLLVIGAELLVILAVVAIALGLYSRSLRRLIRRQQQNLRQALGRDTLPDPAKARPPEIIGPADFLKKQIATIESYVRAHHTTIQLDELDAEQTPGSALVAAVYHRLLHSELDHLEEPRSSEDWELLTAELLPLLNGIEHDGSELRAALESRDRRITNLEKFKKLFFDLEQQWEAAQVQADLYHTQLTTMTQGLDNSEEIEDALQKYHDVYGEISGLLTAPNTGEKQVVTVTRADPRTAEELAKLRNVAADQHRIIGKLQQQLRDADSTEQKEAVIQQLENQLLQQQRYVKESETCIELLEKELQGVVEKLNQYEQSSGASNDLQAETTAMRATLQQFTEESKQLLQWINQLEKENGNLKQAIEGGTSAAVNEGGLQQELAQLQEEYTQLEEKYLALRLKD